MVNRSIQISIKWNRGIHRKGSCAYKKAINIANEKFDF